MFSNQVKVLRCSIQEENSVRSFAKFTDTVSKKVAPRETSYEREANLKKNVSVETDATFPMLRIETDATFAPFQC